MNSPSFSWSKSRLRKFEDCKRQYWYNYYGYWNGWKLNSGKRIRQIYFLKNLRPLDAVVGLIVHEVIKESLLNYRKFGFILEPISMFNSSRYEWKKIEEFTYSKQYRNRKGIAIQEFNYGELTEEAVALAKQKTDDCLLNFFNFFRHEFEGKLAPANIVTIDDNKLGSFLYEYSGIKFPIYAIIDFAIESLSKDFQRMVHIYDWKSGLDDEELDIDRQLRVYGLYVINRWKIKPENIIGHVVRLQNSQEIILTFTADQYENILDIIEVSTTEMLNFENTSENNTPVNTALCPICNFREVCTRS